MNITTDLRPLHRAVAGHRNWLRYLEIVDGVVYVDLAAELVTRGIFGTTPPLTFDPNEARRDSWGRTSLSLLLRDPNTGIGTRIPLDAYIEGTPDAGWMRQHRYTVRFAASGQFDLVSTARPAAYPIWWNVFTVLNTLGTITTAPVGPQRDRSRIDPGPIWSALPDGGWARARFGPGGSQLMLQVGDEGPAR